MLRTMAVAVLALGLAVSGALDAAEPSGKGALKFPDGSMYEGEIRDGKPHGQGVFKFPDGRYYAGAFHPHGRGTGAGVFTRPDGRRCPVFGASPVGSCPWWEWRAPAR